MGFFSTLGDIASSVIDVFSSRDSGSSSSGGSSRNYSSSSSSQTTYEPDKVKVAELEIEKIKLHKETQMELTEFNTRMEAALLEAKFKGFVTLQDSMVQMTETVNRLAQERLHMIENCSLELIKKIDHHYSELTTSLHTEQDEYMQKKLPLLTQQLQNHEEGSSIHTLHSKAIEMDMARNFDYQRTQLEGLQQRQKSLADSALQAKALIYEQSHTLVANRIKQLEQNVEQRFLLAAENGSPTQALLEKG